MTFGVAAPTVSPTLTASAVPAANASPAATASVGIPLVVTTATVSYGSSPPTGIPPLSLSTPFQTIAYVCMTTFVQYAPGIGSRFQFQFPSVAGGTNPTYLLALYFTSGGSWGTGYGLGTAAVSGTTTTVTTSDAIGNGVLLSTTPTCFVLYAQPSTVPLPTPIP